jgi:uncharacterized protein Veg
MSTGQKIIFCNSYSPRTGHNFTARVIQLFSGHQVLADQHSETRLATLLEAYYSLYHSHIYHQTDKDFFDALFIDDLRTKILKKSEVEYVLIKDTSFTGVTHLKNVFPDDVHILLLRDPRDVLLSLFKGMWLNKPGFKYTLKRWGNLIGVYPYYFSHKWSRKIIKKLPDFDEFVVLRYEDLVTKNEASLLKLKELFQCEKSLVQIKKELDAIEVINTSFTEETGAKRIWEARPKTPNFKPVQRKAPSKVLDMAICLGSKGLRKKLNYI